MKNRRCHDLIGHGSDGFHYFLYFLQEHFPTLLFFHALSKI